MTKPKDDAERLANLMDSLAERAAEASEKEILDEAAAAGADVKVEADRVRGVLADAILQAKKQRRFDAAAAHKQSVAAIAERTARLPGSPAARKRLLDRVVQQQPAMRQTVMTLQHREFESFSDGDVESALRQLHALGLLDEESMESDE